MVYYSSVKKKKVLPFATVWMDLEKKYAKGNKLVRERQILYDFIHVWNLMYKLN